MSKLTSFGIGLLAVTASTQAIAQATEAPAPAAQQAAETAESDEGQLADIVVTATRREERLQDVPVSVTAITADSLSASGVIESRTLTQVVPGLLFSRSASVGQPVIRGVGSTGVSGGDEANVAMYIDGVYHADPYSTLMELVEIQRVEVLRGPQGTVFGRNATGGLINVITPDPSFTFRGRVGASYSRMRNGSDGIDLRAYLTGPISDTLAFDFAGLYRESDGYIEDLVRGGALGHQQVFDVRGKILFQPSDAARFVLTAQYGRQESQGNTNVLLDGNTQGRRYPGVILPTGPWQATLDRVPVSDYRRFNTTLRGSLDFGAVNLESTTAYNFSWAGQVSDQDSSNINIGASAPQFWTRTYSQEVRLLSTGGGRFNWIAGLYAFHLDNHAYTLVESSAGPPAPVTSFYLEPDIKTTSYAGFAEGTLQVIDPLFITLGVRYTTEQRSFAQSRNGVSLFPEQERSYNDPTYRAAFRYEITPTINFYGSYGTGFKSGVFNSISLSRVATEPEHIGAAELGFKADLSRALRVNIVGYHYDYTDLQVISRDPVGTFVLQNAASAQIYGAELEVTAIPVQGLVLNGSVTLSRARYEEFPGAQCYSRRPDLAGNTVFTCDASGNHMIRAPEFTFNLGARWSQPIGSGELEIGGNVYHSGRVYYDFSNNFSQDPYYLVNAEIAYQAGNGVRYSLAVSNLFDAFVAQSMRVAPPATDFIPERPRRITAGVQYSF
jgi:iron complex outermembrane receptor protein